MMAGKGQVAGGSLQASPRPGHMSNGPVLEMRLGGSGAGVGGAHGGLRGKGGESVHSHQSNVRWR